jgi:hypothetical protein
MPPGKNIRTKGSNLEKKAKDKAKIRIRGKGYQMRSIHKGRLTISACIVVNQVTLQ